MRENEILTIAKALYQHSIDMDYSDYQESLESDLSDLCAALSTIKHTLSNKNEHWATFYRCLELIAEQTTINETFFQGGGINEKKRKCKNNRSFNSFGTNTVDQPFRN